MPLKVVFMGTPEFAVPCLSRILEDGHQVAGVLTQPDKPKGRGYALAPPPVKKLALSRGLPVFQPQRLRDEAVLEQIRRWGADVIVVVAYGKILPASILEYPPLGCINVHASLLPKYRGAAPIQWSVINGETVTGVTTMYMDQSLDTGDMILAREIPIGPEETAGELHDRLMVLGADCLSETLTRIEAGSAPRIPQPEKGASYAPMLNKELARIDFTQSARDIHNLVRGLSPWPVAYTTVDGKRLLIHKTQALPGPQGAPGQVLRGEQGFVAACGLGALRFVAVQPPGKRVMAGEEYLRGLRIQSGLVLGK